MTSTHNNGEIEQMSDKGKRGEFRFSDDKLAEVGVAVCEVSAAMLGYRQLSIDVVGLNIKRPKVTGGEFLCVVKGLDAEGVPCVAFHSGFGLEDLMQGLASRLKNGSLKWRVDEFMT